MTQHVLVILNIRRHVSAHWAIIRPNTKHSLVNSVSVDMASACYTIKT